MAMTKASEDKELWARVREIRKLAGSGNRASLLLKVMRPSIVQYLANQPIHSGTVATIREHVDEAEREARKLDEKRSKKSSGKEKRP